MKCIILFVILIMELNAINGADNEVKLFSLPRTL